jgi:hypothetical protein
MNTMTQGQGRGQRTQDDECNDEDGDRTGMRRMRKGDGTRMGNGDNAHDKDRTMHVTRMGNRDNAQDGKDTGMGMGMRRMRMRMGRMVLPSCCLPFPSSSPLSHPIPCNYHFFYVFNLYF